MTAFSDTSFLCALYVRQENSPRRIHAAAWLVAKCAGAGVECPAAPHQCNRPGKARHHGDTAVRLARQEKARVIERDVTPPAALEPAMA